MKTSTYLSTLLALIVQVMVIGQTASYRKLNVLGGDKQTKPIKKERVYPTLISAEEFNAKTTIIKTTKQAQNITQTSEVKSLNSVKEITPASEAKNTVPVIDNNTFNYYNNANCYATLVYAGELLKQADGLLLIEKSLRREAKSKLGAEKTTLINSANELVKQAEQKQIQASEIAGKINVEKFKQNNITLYTLMDNSDNIDERISIVAEDLNSEAKHAIKMAKEMREEAYAQQNNSAKLGTMNNAEEKETVALNKQDAAISLIKNATASKHKFVFHDLAVK